MIFAPAMAYTPKVSTSCEQTEVCVNCPITCTVTATFTPEPNAYTGKVTDILPAGAMVVSADGGDTLIAGKITWSSISVPKAGLTKTFTVKFTPGIIGTFQNRASAEAYYDGQWYYSGNSATYTAYSNRVTATDCTPSPEFPTVFLPATMIIGFLGVVLSIRKIKEN